MKPQTVLKIDPIGKTAQEIYAVRDQWISEYKKYIEENPEKEELGAILIDRATRAAEMLIKRYAEVPIEEQNKKDADSDFDYDDYNPEYKEENASLDGDFPLGNAYDAEFATPYFTIENLVRIQFGETHSVPTGHYVEPAFDVLIRKGFIHELLKEWAQAEACYSGGGMGKRVQNREFECRRKKNVEGELAYGAAQHYMESGEWSKVYPYLQKAVAMQNPDAQVDMGLALIYGTFGIPTDYNEGLQLLYQAVWQGSARACMEIVELHDNGAAEIEGEEAERLCKKAADAGDKKAILRLEDGFDARPLMEILKEQAEKGNADAMWWLYKSAVKRHMPEEAQIWYDKALKADQVDALFAEAKKQLLTNRELAEEYLRRAADKGYSPAISELAKLELMAGDDDFWKLAIKQNEPDFSVIPELLERHKRQFAWYLLAAEGGSLDGMTKVVIAYHYGYPCDKNDETAFLWASRAADMGDAYGMYQIGYFYENALSCEKDMNSAVLFYTQAAEEGIFEAMVRLVEIYATGKDGIEISTEKANRYRFLSGIGRD